jgi:hypothetical protein
MAYTNYRRIYEKAFGTIPKEPNGRSYQIHHIDGNRNNNNNLDNLLCVTIQQHYEIHYKQGDFSACAKIAGAMALDPMEISRLSTLAAQKRIEQGTPHFLGGEYVKKLVSEGKHHFQKRKDGTSFASDLVKSKKHHCLTRNDGTSLTRDRVNNRTHHFLGLHREKHHHFNPTIYSFKNKQTGEIIKMTMYDFRNKYKVNHSNLSAMVKGRVKSLAGFVLDTDQFIITGVL